MPTSMRLGDKSKAWATPFLSDGMLKAMKLVPALALAAGAPRSTISQLVLGLRLGGIGGDRACRQLIRQLEGLNLLIVTGALNGDKRERIVELSPSGWGLVRDVQRHLQELVEVLEQGSGSRGAQ